MLDSFKILLQKNLLNFYFHNILPFTMFLLVNFQKCLNFYLAAENAAEGEYHESEQEKPLLEQREKRTEATVTTSFEKRSNYHKKSVDDTKSRSVEGSATRNVEGIELANEVCPFGLAKNLEKQICIIPSRKKSKCLTSRFINAKTDFFQTSELYQFFVFSFLNMFNLFCRFFLFGI